MMFPWGKGRGKDNEWISTIYAVTTASMTFPLHYFVKTSILNLVLLIPDVSIIQYKYLSVARPWWCSQWHFCFIAFGVGGGEGREAREGGLMQMGREGTRQCSLPRSSVFILSLTLLLVNKKLFFWAGAGAVGKVAQLSCLCSTSVFSWNSSILPKGQNVCLFVTKTFHISSIDNEMNSWDCTPISKWFWPVCRSLTYFR